MTSISNLADNSRGTPRRPVGPWTATRHYLRDRRGLFVALAFVLAVAGLALGGAWWGFAAVLPLLYVLPCAAMLAMCMKGHGGSEQNTAAKPDSASPFAGGPATGEAGPR